jgi:hypothetical protein
MHSNGSIFSFTATKSPSPEAAAKVGELGRRLEYPVECELAWAVDRMRLNIDFPFY